MSITHKTFKIEWSMLAHHHVLIVTRPDGERIVHSSTNRRYLEKLATERYLNAKLAF